MSYYDIERGDLAAEKRRIRILEEEIADLKARVQKLEPVVDDDHDMFELEVGLKENYIRGYVTGKFEFIDNVVKEQSGYSKKVRYRVRGYAYRKNIEFITRHASWVSLQPRLHKRKGEIE